MYKKACYNDIRAEDISWFKYTMLRMIVYDKNNEPSTTPVSYTHLKRDTNQLAWQLKLKGARYSVYSANKLFAKESFAARHPETRYAQAVNTAMLAFFENK